MNEAAVRKRVAERFAELVQQCNPRELALLALLTGSLEPTPSGPQPIESSGGMSDEVKVSVVKG